MPGVKTTHPYDNWLVRQPQAAPDLFGFMIWLEGFNVCSAW
jgi:hypothetical protein